MQENDEKRFSKSGREDWSVEDIANEAVNLMPDEIQRQMLRGDESEGDADERDVVGNVNPNETPQGREATKNNKSDAD